MSVKMDPASTRASSIIDRRNFMLVVIALLVCSLIYSTKFSFPSLGAINNADSTSFDLQDSPLITDKVAVIIEDRPIDVLAPLILHFASVLGPEWPILLFTSQDIVPSSAPLQRAIQERRISLRLLPPDVHFKNHDSVSEFLTDSWLWQQLAPASHVLLFQADSILCANSPLKVEDFLHYDFIGAPIVGHGEGYNGGLSLRNRSAMLEIVTTYDWKVERDLSGNREDTSVKFEDQWFYKKLSAMPSARLPSIDVAMTFSVETLWFDRPLGFHQVTRWQSRHIEEVDRWCPEHRMATSHLMVMHQ